MINIPSNVSENDTMKWLRPIDVVSCQIIETKSDNNEKQAILEAESLDCCERLYKKSGKLFCK